MITPKDLFNVLSSVVPLYLTMFLAYASVKWWKLFTPEQCSGINRFVAIFAIPLLSFEFISRINPFKLNFMFIAADVASKVFVLLILFFWAKLFRAGSLDWSITAFSLTMLPNTLVMGIPLLKSMYGNNQEGLMIQVVVMQSIIWYTLLLFLFEYRAARNALLSSPDGEEMSGESVRDPEAGGEDVGHAIGEIDQQKVQGSNSNRVAPDTELQGFVWRCKCCDSQGPPEQPVQICDREDENVRGDKKDGDQHRDGDGAGSGMFGLIMRMVCSKLMRNPNSYASLIGLSWAFVSSRWDIKKPLVMEESVTLLSNAGLGMAMFSLGLFMALQPRIVACGWRLAAYGILMRFVAGPAVMAVASVGVGLRGTILKVSIVQAALPQGIVPFVFAREYNLHPEMLSTAVIFGMIVSLPFTILYYVFLCL